MVGVQVLVGKEWWGQGVGRGWWGLGVVVGRGGRVQG